MSPLRALLTRVRKDESAFTLIEVMVSSIVVVLVSVGVLKSLDAANARSGDQKFKGVAANLAQQDMERLRAYRAQDLSNVTETRCVWQTPAGAMVQDPECNDTDKPNALKYRVISRTDWVSDSTGTRSCGTGARADYIRISSTVVWIDPSNAETGQQRVSLASIVAPRAGSFSDEGSLAVEIQDRNGVGRAGVTVDVTGPKALSGTTDANGCLFFGYLPEGNYTVGVQQAGLIDANGNSQISRQFGVQDASVTSAVIELDVGGTMTVNFDSKQSSTGASLVSRSDYVSISHSGLQAPSWKAFGTNNSWQTGFAIGPLYPFTNPYAFYSGNCPGANPAVYGVASPTSFQLMGPGGTPTVTAREPAVRVRRGTTNLASNQTFTLTWASNLLAARGGGPTFCAGTDTIRIGSGGFMNASLVSGTTWAADNGVPYGTYNLCHINAGTKWVRTGVEVINPNGQIVDLVSAGAGTTCP